MRGMQEIAVVAAGTVALVFVGGGSAPPATAGGSPNGAACSVRPRSPWAGDWERPGDRTEEVRG